MQYKLNSLQKSKEWNKTKGIGEKRQSNNNNNKIIIITTVTAYKLLACLLAGCITGWKEILVFFFFGSFFVHCLRLVLIAVCIFDLFSIKLLIITLTASIRHSWNRWKEEQRQEKENGIQSYARIHAHTKLKWRETKTIIKVSNFFKCSNPGSSSLQHDSLCFKNKKKTEGDRDTQTKGDRERHF